MRLLRIAGRTCGIDIGHDPHRKGCGAHHAGHPRNDRDRDREDQVDVDAADHEAAECRDHHQRQHDQRKCQQDIHEALDDIVDASAEIGRGHAENGAERRADEGRGEADHKRGARSVDQPGADIAAIGVGPAPMLPRWRSEDRSEVDGQRVVGRDPFREDAGEHHRHDDDETDRTERLLLAELDIRIRPALGDFTDGGSCNCHEL